MLSNKPAVVVCRSETASISIAALCLLDRLVIALHRGGCDPIIIVCDGNPPALKRSEALEINTQLQRNIPPITQPTLLAAGNLLVQPDDVRRVIRSGGRLANSRGEALPIGLASSFSGTLEQSLTGLENVSAAGVAELIADRRTARQAGERLWESLASKTDGLVDKHFNRPLGRRVSKVLVHTPITPNQISLFSMAVGLAAAYCFSPGTYVGGVLGALGLQISAIIDCIDGDIARILFKETRLGKWLDIGADQLVHLTLFAAIAVGLMRRGTDAPALFLGISAVAGVLLSFGVVMRGMLLPEDLRRGRLQQLMDSAANRDFSVLLLLLAIGNQLKWFLWLAGLGIHAFWITALLLQYSNIRCAGISSKSSL